MNGSLNAVESRGINDLHARISVVSSDIHSVTVTTWIVSYPKIGSQDKLIAFRALYRFVWPLASQ